MKAKRLAAAQARINRFPYRYEAIDNAYSQFLEDGTLPDDNELAGRVLRRVLHARKPVLELEAERRSLAAGGLHQPYGTTREMLFREACCRLKPARDLARLVLTAMVKAGYDPTDAELIGPEMEPLEFASIGMRLLGWPHDYVRPEHQKRLKRVLQQQEVERANRPRNNDEWDRGAGKAMSAFLTRGAVPTDARYFAFVMLTSEMFALHAHYFGRGDEDLLAAFDAVATGNDEERGAALQRIGSLQARASGAQN